MFLDGSRRPLELQAATATDMTCLVDGAEGLIGSPQPAAPAPGSIGRLQWASTGVNKHKASHPCAQPWANAPQ